MSGFLHMVGTPNQRFRRNVFKNPRNKCWVWNGSIRKNDGYGQMHFFGRPRLAHRISWTLNIGEIPKGMFVLHKCDVIECVNPAHLFLGTHRDNMMDMALKKRSNIGEKNPGSKLKRKFIPIIMSMHKDGISQSLISKKFKVNQSVISRVIRGKTWVL